MCFRGRVDARRDFKTFVAVVANTSKNAGRKVIEGNLFRFKSNEDRRQRLKKAYVGKALILGAGYNIHMHMEMEGIFAIKVIPLGGNLCMMEELEEGFIEDFIGEEETWWKTRFSEVKKWEEVMVDEYRDVWLRVYGIPAHVWHSEFFVALTEMWGSFSCIDDNTAIGEEFDLARIMVKVPISFKTLDTTDVNINEKVFKLMVREDVMGQTRFGTSSSITHYSDSEEIGYDDNFEVEVEIRLSVLKTVLISFRNVMSWLRLIGK